MLINCILKWLRQEDACLVSREPDGYLTEMRVLCPVVHVISVDEMSAGILRVKWRGWGCRRGVLLIENDGMVFFGYTVAGNGTPAYMFPISTTSSLYTSILFSELPYVGVTPDVGVTPESSTAVIGEMIESYW